MLGLDRATTPELDFPGQFFKIGGGQEINRGEAGLLEWFDALRDRFSHWDIYVSSKINDIEYTKENRAEKLISELDCEVTDELHLSVSLRSFRSEIVSEFVKTLLDVDVKKSRQLYLELSQNYPIVLTRDLDKAKQWVQKMARGTERYGLTASSGAKRLRSFGVWVQSKVEAKTIESIEKMSDKNEEKNTKDKLKANINKASAKT